MENWLAQRNINDCNDGNDGSGGNIRISNNSRNRKISHNFSCSIFEFTRTHSWLKACKNESQTFFSIFGICIEDQPRIVARYTVGIPKFDEQKKKTLRQQQHCSNFLFSIPLLRIPLHGKIRFKKLRSNLFARPKTSAKPKSNDHFYTNITTVAHIFNRAKETKTRIKK